MSTRHARIQVPRDPELEQAISRGRDFLGAKRPASKVVRELALRGAEAMEADAASTRRGEDFLVSVAEGRSGINLRSLRDVRDRAWR